MIRSLSILLFILSHLFFYTGCKTTGIDNLPDNFPVEQVPTLTGTIQKASLHIGVLNVDPKAYGWWDGLCLGADEDAKYFDLYAKTHGITNRIVLISQDATKKKIKDSIIKLTKNFSYEDILFITNSGHGHRVYDFSGDEASKYDTQWCLYDGKWLDDDIWKFIQTLPPCQILMVTDICFSEASWKTTNVINNVMTFKTVSKIWNGTIIQLSACREDESALGNVVGGQFSVALTELKNPDTLQSWFDEAKKMVKN